MLVLLMTSPAIMYQDPRTAGFIDFQPERPKSGLNGIHQRLLVNGVTLDVLVSGPVGARPLLLIQGLGMQRTDWPEGLVAALVNSNFRVIQYDPRDIGLSENMDHLGRAQVYSAAFGRMMGIKSTALYSLPDLAEEAAALLVALQIPSAHVCGLSMGGMVAQHLAERHPDLVQSLTLMMTNSGSLWLPAANALLMQRLSVRPPSRRDFPALVAHFVRMNRLIESPAWPEPEDVLTERVRFGLARSYRPHATSRQMVAVLADGDRTALLRRIRVPVQIIHGCADLLVPVAAGHDLAKQIAGAVLDEIEGMGHDLPRALWPRFVDDICAVADRATALECSLL